MLFVMLGVCVVSSGVVRVHAVVSGLVQGVGFRYFTVTVAHDLGLTGWVRNLRDGDVEVEAQGPVDRVSALCARLGEGPRWSRVDCVATREVPVEDAESVFRVLPDGR